MASTYFKLMKFFQRDTGKELGANGQDGAESIVHVTSKGRLYADPEKQLRTKEAQAAMDNVGSILESLESLHKSPAATKQG